MIQRPRRLRSHPTIRELVNETDLKLSHLIQPYFLADSPAVQEAIPGFTNQYRWGIDSLSSKVEKDLERGVKTFLLFGGTQHKDAMGSAAYDEKNIIPSTLLYLRKRFGNVPILITDVCLCPFTNHGHCGLVDGEEIQNDPSLKPLAQMALVHAQAGANLVAPSDMMDGRIGFIRNALDEKGFEEIGILAYTAKYASSYYGPFREALQSAPQGFAQGSAKIPAKISANISDRSTYQMDFRNVTDALRELSLDISEGADMVMVKPALAYLDIIRTFRETSSVPVVAYSVSGEYEMVKALSSKGMCDERKMALENLTAIQRAGANAIITYFASEAAEKGWIR